MLISTHPPVFAALALMGRKPKTVNLASKKSSTSAGGNSAVALPPAVDVPRKKTRLELEDENAELRSMNYILFNHWSNLCQDS
jgi:hypothetical protein